MAVKISSAYDQFLEYLAQKVSPDDILAFKASEDGQERLEVLTEKNKAGEMTALEFNHLMTLLKLKTHKASKQA